MTKLCLIAGNKDEAKKWASGQNLDDDTWFFPESISDLLFKSNFHVIVIGTAGLNIPSLIFEKLYQTALTRGKLGRY